MSNDPEDEDPKRVPQDLFPFDEMSPGETSSLIRRAHQITGAADRPLPNDPSLKPMTGAQLAFRPSAPPRQGNTGAHAAFKPATGTQPAYKPGTGTQPAFKPSTGVQPAFTPTSGTHAAVKRSPTGTNTFATFRPQERSAPDPAPRDEEEEGPPVFDPERLQAQIRAMSLTDSALGRAVKSQKPNKALSSSAEDTFVKAKMKQAESKVPDFDLDEDLG